MVDIYIYYLHTLYFIFVPIFLALFFSEMKHLFWQQFLLFPWHLYRLIKSNKKGEGERIAREWTLKRSASVFTNNMLEWVILLLAALGRLSLVRFEVCSSLLRVNQNLIDTAILAEKAPKFCHLTTTNIVTTSCVLLFIKPDSSINPLSRLSGNFSLLQ